MQHSYIYMKCLEYEMSAGVDSIKWTDRKFIPEQLALIRWTGNNKTFFGEWWLVFWDFGGWTAEKYKTAKFESVLHNSKFGATWRELSKNFAGNYNSNILCPREKISKVSLSFV